MILAVFIIREFFWNYDCDTFKPNNMTLNRFIFIYFVLDDLFVIEFFNLTFSSNRLITQFGEFKLVKLLKSL